jgi:phage terminase small subunit
MSAKNEHGLTPQQEVFAQEVAKGKSLSEAYRAAYKAAKMKPETVNDSASKLMANPQITHRVRQLQAAAADRAELEATQVLREIKRVALSDIAGIMHDDGRVKLPHELDPATRAAVASFKIDEYGRIEYKFWDKNSALDKAGKILGLYELDNKQKSDPLVDLLASLSGNVLGPAQGLPPIDDEDE